MSADEQGEEEHTAESTPAALDERLDELAETLEEAETAVAFDAVASDLAAIRSDLETAREATDEEDDSFESVESTLEQLEADLEDARPPSVGDVVAVVEHASDRLVDGDWTEQGEAELIEAVDTFLESINPSLQNDVTLVNLGDDVPDRLGSTLENAVAAIEEHEFDPDDDAETIATLLEESETLDGEVDAAQTWDDLTVREQLQVRGYYDVLEHVKDYPPEWHALKVHEQQGNVEMVLLALETFESDFMEEHALDALERMGPEAALEPMLERAGKRDKRAIAILGKIAIADEPVVETLCEYVDTDSDPLLQTATFKALGEMGAETAVSPIADQLVAENPEVRSHAARALGLIGDTRAISPLEATLTDDEEDTVRASAAWALNQIGTEAALEAAAEYADDRSFLLQAEAEKAAAALDSSVSVTPLETEPSV